MPVESPDDVSPLDDLIRSGRVRADQISAVLAQNEGDAYAREDLPQLPGSLEAAIAAFAEDESLQRAMGVGFCDYYATSRAWELKAWRETVTDWERDRYDRSV